jgi:hypothetical protein
MPANEFEKQVQEKMEDFRLNPSASVWKNVEDELREKRKKRIIFFFILPAAILLLMVSVYFLNHKPGASSPDSIVNSQHPVASPPSADRNDGIQHPASSQQSIVDSQESIVNSQHPVSSVQHPAPRIQHPASSIQRPASSTQDPTSGKNNSVKNKQDNTVANVDISVSNPAIQKKTGVEENVNKISREPDATETVINQKATDNEQTDAVSVNTDKPEIKNAAKTEEPKQAVAKKEPGKTRTRWGLDFSVGVSSIQTEPFPKLKFGASADALTATGPQNPSGGGSASGGTAAATPPSDITQGLSFRIGYTREWQVSERSSFSGGVQYAYASTHMKIGSAVDSTFRVSASYNNYSSIQVNKIYRAGDNDKYTNSFHFVTIPIGYHWMVNKNLPIQLNFEVSLGYLLSTNALVYSSSNGGVYYKDEDAFNKMQFAIGTGLSYRFKTKKGTEWVIGPQLSFNTNSLLANDHKQYLWFGGLNTQLFFPKKKK